MQFSYAAAAVSSAFDDPNLIAYGGLEPVVRLAERCRLPTLVGEHVRLPVSKDGIGAFPAAKVMSAGGRHGRGRRQHRRRPTTAHEATAPTFFGSGKQHLT
ncbi:hypothetical protein AB4Z54_25550 [Streptomyces sp. MCAF7]